MRPPPLTVRPVIKNPQDYIGSHCALEQGGRLFLGEITDVCPDEMLCTVKHFNGELWPFNPSLYRLEILERTYPQSEDV